jgi:hypothetical protein
MVTLLLDDFKNRDMFFLGYHMFENDRENNYNIYNDQNYPRKIELLNQNLYIGGFYSYSINKNGAKKLVEYIQNNGIKYGIDYIIKFVSDLKLYELQPQIVFSQWNENGKKIDSDIQNLYASLDLNNIISIKNSDDFVFIPYLDQSENDLYYKHTTLEHYMQIANNDSKCAGFNSVGYFKSYINIHTLYKSPYFTVHFPISCTSKAHCSACKGWCSQNLIRQAITYPNVFLSSLCRIILCVKFSSI